MKKIEQQFEIKLGKYVLKYKARNYEEDVITFDDLEQDVFFGIFRSACIKDTRMLRKLAKGLLKIADKIDKDPDF